MKILFVSSYYLPYVSGLTIHAMRLAEGLARKKHQVTVLTNAHLPDLLKSENLSNILIKRARPLFRFSRGFVSPNLIFIFLKLLPENDVVVLHLPMPEAFIFAPLSKIFRKKVILIYHADLNLPSWSIFGRLIENIVWLNHCIAGIFSNNIVAYSSDYANFSRFLRVFKNKTVRIFPPVTMRVPDEKIAKQQKDGLGLSGAKIIGFAGRFAEEKGGDILIESIPYLVEKIKDVKIVFAGEDNLVYEDFYKRKKDLIDRYKDRILFLGLVAPKNMPEFFAMCDVLALPSRAECFGLVQAEAMLCGTPVVAFDIPGGRVPVLETGMGELAKKYDLKDFAGKIIKIIKHRKQYRKDREEIGKIFSYEDTIKKYEQLFFGRSSPSGDHKP